MQLNNRQICLQQREARITCVVPVFNEAAGVEKFLLALHEKLKSLTDFGEILVVDDGSRDETAAVVKSLLQKLPLKLICFSRNFSKEMALTAGLNATEGDIAILIDADFQHPIELLPLFLQRWAEGADMVYGVQQDRRRESLSKRFFSRLFYRLMARFANVELPANAGDFRLLDGSVIAALNQCPERNRFMKGLYAWVGFKSVAIPFTAPIRASGKTTWRFRNLAQLALTGLISFSDVPLRVWGLIGFIISSTALGFGLCVVFATWIYGADVPGYPTIVAAIMFLGGIQLLSVGILGEYIARIFSEVKQRPPYIISQKYGFDTSVEGKKV